jgi:hypothetical protein
MTMGVQLDWQIDTERQARDRQDKEDPQLSERRSRRFLRFLLFLLVILSLAGGVVFFVLYRLDDANRQLEALLIESIQAEVTALRIGDAEAFLERQRSAGNDWRLAQEAQFNRYQALKADADLQLTGRVVNVEVDGQRGRAQVEEIIDGVPYVRTWFYWRYDAEIVNDREIPAGWYHVPPDFTFWGAPSTLTTQYVTIRYQSLDEAFVQQMSQQLNDWLSLACDFMNCTNLPLFTIDVVSNNMPEPIWTEEQNQWQMVMPSPYADIARSDMPFDTQYRIDTATLIANRLVDNNVPAPNYPADAYYLRSSLVSWLVGQFVAVDTNAFLMKSLYANYGQDALARLIVSLNSDASMAIFGDVIAQEGVAIADANLDWRDLLTWRIVTENDLIARADQEAYLRLYDMRLADVADLAYERFGSGRMLDQPVVIHAERRTSSDGTPQLLATVQVADGQQFAVVLNLVNNVWLRAN